MTQERRNVQSKFIVMSDPVAGKEDEYNLWYAGIHIGGTFSLC